MFSIEFDSKEETLNNQNEIN